jgi:hypothetical protein
MTKSVQNDKFYTVENNNREMYEIIIIVQKQSNWTYFWIY